jgi:hypothetical protein
MASCTDDGTVITESGYKIVLLINGVEQPQANWRTHTTYVADFMTHHGSASLIIEKDALIQLKFVSLLGKKYTVKANATLKVTRKRIW